MSVRYGILSTYPPTQCGLATFTAALVESLTAGDGASARQGWSGSRGDAVEIVACVDEQMVVPPHGVSHQWVRDSPRGATAAATALNRTQIAVIQHEYGIFGGRDGEDVLDVLRALRVPAIVVLHTVLVTPTPRQKTILEQLARQSVAVVTMTQTARQRLADHYLVDTTKIHVIPHGAADNRLPGHRAGIAPGQAPTILTWGLLGPGKGIEWAIDAMAQLRDLTPAARYRVVGQTHPKILERHGEKYRDSLHKRASAAGVAHTVQFDARYLTRPELHRMVRAADIVLLPYDSREQVTSGVLIEAVAAGKPVVSTGFPHAVELLSGGAGLIVGRQDPAAIAEALRRVLTEPGLAASMGAEAHRIAPALLWPTVARQYRHLATTAIVAAARELDIARASA